VDLAALQQWRARALVPNVTQRADHDILERLARSFADAMKRDRAYDRVGISEAQAGGFLALVFERLWMNLTGRSRDEILLPSEIEHLCAIWVQSRETCSHGRE
jgi:hypothetical protein